LGNPLAELGVDALQRLGNVPQGGVRVVNDLKAQGSYLEHGAAKI
jgi:hypothetical protein